MNSSETKVSFTKIGYIGYIGYITPYEQRAVGHVTFVCNLCNVFTPLPSKSGR